MLLITANFVYHRICLTQIKLFRFIGFHFVCKLVDEPSCGLG